MGRELRPRKARPSYAAMLEYEHDQPVDEGPSHPPIAFEDEGDSSEFAPEDASRSQADPDNFLPLDPRLNNAGEQQDYEEDELREASVALSTTSVPMKSKGKGRGKEKAKTTTGTTVNTGNEIAVKPTTQTVPGLSRPSNRQMYTLPTPSVHHRHRAVPLFSRIGGVERLEAPPILFGPPRTTTTNNFTHSTAVTDRVNKAWGYNVGSGPLWELIEDRAWFKEAIVTDGGLEKEYNRRPKVYGSVKVGSGWQRLSIECAVYLNFKSDSCSLILFFLVLEKHLPICLQTRSLRMMGH